MDFTFINLVQNRCCEKMHARSVAVKICANPLTMLCRHPDTTHLDFRGFCPLPTYTHTVRKSWRHHWCDY